MRLRHIITTLALLCALALPAITVAGIGPPPPTGNISSTDKYAWSETSGWNNFAPIGGGVTVYPDHPEYVIYIFECLFKHGRPDLLSYIGVVKNFLY